MLGLTTTTIAATDAGADSAAQTGAAASNPADAIFDILMASSAMPDADTDMVTTAPAEGTCPADASDASKLFAADMEQMVQALTITADVVANGMAARTTPIREILLTIEAPVADMLDADMLPELSATLPIPTSGPDLKISQADPTTNLDPALLLLMPLQPTMKASEPAIETVETPEAEALTGVIGVIASEHAQIEDKPAPQLLLPSVEEIHGPWRAEVHGPILGPDRTMITTPVHLSVIEPVLLPVSVPFVPVTNKHVSSPEALQVSDEMLHGPQMMSPPDHAHDKAITPESIRVLTISVPVQHTIDMDDAEEPVQAGDEASLPLAAPHDEDVIIPVTTGNTFTPENFPPQAMMILAADRQLDQPARVDQAVADPSTDVLEAPHRIWQHMPIVINTILPTNSLIQMSDVASASETKPVSTEAEHIEEPISPLPQPNMPLNKAAMTLRQPLPRPENATLSETIIASSVANTSSRSSANIRDLVKLGVRDIEIVNGTGTETASNVSPQVQMVASDLPSTAPRAQMADAFAPAGNESNNAERRAQAHEIRLRAIERQVIAAVRDGADTIRMQLYPPGLGQIVIRLTMDGSKLKMTTKASSQDAADSLRTIEGDLREALSTGGLALAGFDVSDDGERDDQRHARSQDANETKTNPRSAKSESFALDMNA